VAATLVAELMPAQQRGMMVVLLESFWAYGSIAAALIGFFVIPALGWRAALLIGAIPGFYAFVIQRPIPESPCFLVSRGRYAEADVVLRRIAQASRTSVPPPSRQRNVAAAGARHSSTTPSRVPWAISPAATMNTTGHRNGSAGVPDVTIVMCDLCSSGPSAA
jgi:putative MFS transporter